MPWLGGIAALRAGRGAFLCDRFLETLSRGERPAASATHVLLLRHQFDVRLAGPIERAGHTIGAFVELTGDPGRVEQITLGEMPEVAVELGGEVGERRLVSG